MSYSTLFIIAEDGNVQSHADFRNSWGWAARVWSTMSKIAFGDEAFWLNFAGQNVLKLWEIVDNTNYGLCERLTLLATIDMYVFKADCLTLISENIRAFALKHPVPEGHIDNLAAIADKIDEVHREYPTYAIAFQATSVASGMWEVPEGDETRPYNVLIDTDHYTVDIAALREDDLTPA